MAYKEHTIQASPDRMSLEMRGYVQVWSQKDKTFDLIFCIGMDNMYE